MNKIVIIFLIIFSASPKSYSNEFTSFKNLSIDNPLSTQATKSIIQDSDGFMWFGAQEGLHRYDGHQYLSFHHDANDPNSLSSDVISTILLDVTQQIWVATRGGGLSIYREKTHDFRRITTKSGDISISNNNINTLIEDKNGNMWVGTENGVNIIFRDGNKWRKKLIIQELGNPKSLSNNVVESILQTANNEIWVGTSGGGISVFDLQGEFIRAVKLKDENTQNLSSKLIKVLFQDKQKNIWIGTIESGLIKLSADNGDISRYQFDVNNINSLSSNAIEVIYQDSADRIWVGTDRGLMIYDQSLNQFSRINHSVTNLQSLANDFVLTIFEDSNKMIWIGTFSGISRWDPHMTTFHQYNDEVHPEVSSSLIMGFTQLNNEELIFTTYANGIFILSSKTNKITPLKLNISTDSIKITTIFYDNNILWVGTRASGLFEINLTSKQSKNHKHINQNKDSISANSITSIIKDKKGNIWVSTYHKGLNRLNDDGSFSRFEMKKPLTNKGPSTNHILQIIEDHQGFIWLATYGGGLNRFNPTTEIFTHINHDDNIKTSLSSDISWIMMQDKDKNLWVGTQAAGINLLSRINLENGIFNFQHFDIKNGMKDQTVYGFSQDSIGNIWFSSNKGISRYSPNNKAFKHFDTRHGLVSLEYNHSVVFRGLDNTLYFGSAMGFTSVNPDNILNDQIAPKVKLTNIFKLNEAMKFEHGISKLKSLTFEYSDQLISIEYVGLNYSDPESTRYKYRLLGFDDEWIDVGKLRRATYTNLPQGNYKLQIIAGNDDNVWTEPGLSLDITINPAPWKTWWAYLIYVSFIALIFLSYSRFLNRKLVEEQIQRVMLKEQVAEKTQEFFEKNIELEHANKLLENAATIDKLTGVKSRRYLDIYIEQASQLMLQIHKNLLPVQRNLLPRLYLLMVKINSKNEVNNSQLLNLTDLLLYSRNQDDLVIRWSDNTFAIIGYEKDNNAADLAARLGNRFDHIFTENEKVQIAYSFYPFDIENPMETNWDQVSALIEHGLNITELDFSTIWFGLHSPKEHPFSFLSAIKTIDFEQFSQLIVIKKS